MTLTAWLVGFHRLMATPIPEYKHLTSGRDYAFEILPDKSVSFRRTDMDNPDARDALRTFLCLWFQADIRCEDIDHLVATTPPGWPYLALTPEMLDGKSGARIVEAKREPGKNSGSNAVITNITSTPRH